MSIYAGPNVIEDGLICHIDAANERCYPGTGSTLTDLSGNGKNGILNNSPTFSSDNGGQFIFNGVNQTIGFGIGNTFFPLSQWTLEIAFKSTGTTPTTGTSPALLGFTYGWRLFVGTNGLSAGLDNGVGITTFNAGTSQNYQDSNWHYIAWSNDGTVSNFRVDNLPTQQTNQTWLATTRWPTNSFQLGRDQNNSMYFFTGSIALFRFYNRVLSVNEVSLNFASIRGRYGL